MMPYTRTDKIVLAIFDAIMDNRWLNRLWTFFGAPTLAFRMPDRRLPDGNVGFRVLRLEQRCDCDDC